MGHLVAASDMPRALELLSRAVDVYSDANDKEGKADALHDRGALHLRAKMLDQALLDFDGAIAADDKYAPAFLGRADVFFLKEDMLRASHNYDRYVDLHRSFYDRRPDIELGSGDELVLEVLIKQCACYSRIGDSPMVKECVELILQSPVAEAPHTPTLAKLVAMAHYYHAKLFEEEGDEEGAVAALGEAVAKDPNVLSAYVKRATILRRLGRNQQAARDEHIVTTKLKAAAAAAAKD